MTEQQAAELISVLKDINSKMDLLVNIQNDIEDLQKTVSDIKYNRF